MGKNVEAKYYLRDQIIGQAKILKSGQKLFGANFQAKIGPGQADGTRPGFIVCRYVVHEVCKI